MLVLAGLSGEMDLPGIYHEVSKQLQYWERPENLILRKAAARKFVVVTSELRYKRYKHTNVRKALITLLLAWEVAYLYHIPLEWYIHDNPLWDL